MLQWQLGLGEAVRPMNGETGIESRCVTTCFGHWMFCLSNNGEKSL